MTDNHLSLFLLAAITVTSFSGICGKKWDVVETLWPNAVVPYKFSRSIGMLDKKGVLQESIQEIEDKTCIRFINRTKEPAYLDMTAGFDCTGPLGYQGKPQVLTLMLPFCLDKKRLLRQLLHTLGMPNEQQRPDRDSFIKINWDNINPLDTSFFAKLNESSMPFGEMPYDYNSLMHADATYKARKPSEPSMTPLRDDVQLGKAEGLSDLDVQKLNFLYC